MSASAPKSTSCLACHAPIEPFLTFGRMPIANGFLDETGIDQEFFFNLAVGHCTTCHMVQLTELLPPTQLFHENYAYMSSISQRMAAHFERFAADVRSRLPSRPDPFVVEVGSNDGIMLRHFAAADVRHLGVEPSANVAAMARTHGVRTVVRFFDEALGQELRDEHGPADLLLGANVICHIPNIHSFLRGVTALLRDDGLFVFEEPYLGDIIAQTAYDQIYDEHVFYFCAASLTEVLAQHQLELVDVAPQAVHGGSMRWYVARQGARPATPAVAELRRTERELGLFDAATYEQFADRVFRSRDGLVELLTRLRQEGARVVGYGATSKSTTVTNLCGIGPDLVEFISDTTPWKQGKVSPGTHIPVLPYERFTERYPDYALLFAWNHGAEIIEKETAFRRGGGKFIRYIPRVEVME